MSMLLIWVIITGAAIGVVIMMVSFANPGAAVSVVKFLFVRPVKTFIRSTASKPNDNKLKKLATIELKANQDVARGNKMPVNRLFSNANLWQNFQLLDDVDGDKTHIRITIVKAGSFHSQATISRKQGEDTNLCVLLAGSDFRKKIKATDDIKAGEELSVTLERVLN